MKKHSKIATVLTVVSAVVIGSILLFGGKGDASDLDDGNVTILSAGTGCDKTAIASQALLNKGFKSNEFVVGEDKIDWSKSEANERGHGSFGSTTAKSAKDVTKQFAAKDDASKAATKT
jgi:hypothetical protein